MKILITSPSLDETENVSGISTVVKQIVENADAEFFHFTAGRKDGLRFGITWMLAQIILIPRFLLELRSFKPGIVHINTALTTLSIFRDSVLTFIARIFGFPVLLHIHGGKFLSQGFGNRLSLRLTKSMLRLANVVLALSASEKRFIKSLQQKIDVRILRNAVPFDDVQKFERAPTNERSIVFFGRLHEGKGLTEIVRAIKVLVEDGQEFQFRCYGAGEMADSFVAQMTEILGERFYFGGVVSGDEKWRALAESNIFLLPSHYEGLPMSLLEAMAVGCFPIVSDVGSVSEVVENEINGFLIEPRNSEQIVKTLKRLFSGEFDQDKLCKAARSTIKDRYNLTDYLRNLETIYEEFEDQKVDA